MAENFFNRRNLPIQAEKVYFLELSCARSESFPIAFRY
jgi:hypothetical protein